MDFGEIVRREQVWWTWSELNFRFCSAFLWWNLNLAKPIQDWSEKGLILRRASHEMDSASKRFDNRQRGRKVGMQGAKVMEDGYSIWRWAVRKPKLFGSRTIWLVTATRLVSFLGLTGKFLVFWQNYAGNRMFVSNIYLQHLHQEFFQELGCLCFLLIYSEWSSWTQLITSLWTGGFSIISENLHGSKYFLPFCILI